MRRFVLPLLSLYLDFIIVDAILGVLAWLLRPRIEALIGMEFTWTAQVVASIVVLTLIRLVARSPGEWLVAVAEAEREAGIVARQWPNLVLGGLGVLSGLKEMVRWTLPGDGIPFLLMVEETPLKVAAVTIYGVAVLAGGVMLLRFMPGARLVNLVVILFGLAVGAVNFIFNRDAIIAAVMDRRAYQGLPPDLERAEALANWGMLIGFAFATAMLALLWLSRERR